MAKIEVKNVYKIFGTDPINILPMVKKGATKEEVLEETGHTVGLDNVSMSVEEGETFVCMGLSGSGKSTLIRHLNRLIDPTDGEIIVDGTNVLQLNEKELIEFRKHKMSMVFQRFGLFPHKTVIQNIAYGLEIQGKELNERNKIAMAQIEAVGLRGFEHQYPSQLSGGMQQRVGLGRALATNPGILLMDEAFSALDPLIRSDMQKQLLDLQSELKKTIVFITHDLDESLKLANEGLQKFNNHPTFMVSKIKALHRLNKTEDIKLVRDALFKKQESEQISQMVLAQGEYYFGNMDAAILKLEKSMENRDIKLYPFDPRNEFEQ